jgi:hypothetical protein
MRRVLLLATVPLLVLAGDLKFSDPANQAPPPPRAAGYPSRAPDLDVLPGFGTPPAGYGEVAFYWWLGDPLTRERLTWELDQLKGHSISAVQVNYAHSDKGGNSWGLTYESEPRLFTEPWWNLFGWFLKRARTQGMAVSLSDYTLGWVGQGWYFDEILRKTPDIHGAVLESSAHTCSGSCSWETSPALVNITAYRLQSGAIVAGSAVDLRPHLNGRRLSWNAPAGDWRVIEVRVKDRPESLDPMHPASGRQMIAKFFQRFEDRNPGESGRGLNFFFSDELSFGVRGWLWNRTFAEEFQKRKGYDLIPELTALFEDIGPRTPKIRLDYSDVMVALEEENYFRPLYDWHRSRGMLYGCDHGGRGRDVTEFGDYFRTQRWMTGPGNDQPGLRSDVIKNKVSSSITHLYERQRTWLEGYYGSGWGTTTEQLVDATWRNFVQGQNLLTLHGLYYSTHGGWWEWAPPCNHFRNPYWNHMAEFLKAVERMSYLLSQGRHRADVAVVYPVAPVEAGLGGKESVAAAFELGQHLYERGIDFDFIDFESLARAKAERPFLTVSGEQYRVLVLPAMRAVRSSTVDKALEFHRAGGLVIALGALPEASDRAGRDDASLNAAVRASFDRRNHVETPAEVESLINTSIPRDFACAGTNASILHRRAGARDVYFVYGVPANTECTFRAAGKVELWDPWTGTAAPLAVFAQTADTTRIRMPLDRTEAQLIVFSPGRAEIAAPAPGKTTRSLAIGGPWEFELKPTLDNRYGDFRLPATDTMIAAEARRFRYSDETAPDPGWQNPAFDDSKWHSTTYTYGPHYSKLGPLPDGADLPDIDHVDPAQPVLIGSRAYRWQPYEFSMRWGVEGDPGHEGYHGLKEEVSPDFIALGTRKLTNTSTTYVREPEGARYFLWTSVFSAAESEARFDAGGLSPARVWLNGAVQTSLDKPVHLKAGANTLLVRYDEPGRAHFLLKSVAAPRDWKQKVPLAMPWYNNPAVLAMDTRPNDSHPAGWYRFVSPPGLRAMKIVARGTLRAWAAGRELETGPGHEREDGTREYHVSLREMKPVLIALRIEQQRGFYAGTALPEPVEFSCGPGTFEPRDWSGLDGLSSYSGGAWYRKTVDLTAEQTRDAVLDLGRVVSTAEVRVNGRPAGTKLAPPWKLNIAGLMRPGQNRLEILVYNTLANHYQTIPTRYRGSPVSGLIGPVRLEYGVR